MKLVFDIGANIGRTIDIFKNNAEKVIAFEPNPKLCTFLKEKYMGQNVVVDCRGLSNDIGSKIFKISNADTISTFSDDWINNSRFTGHYVWNEEVNVSTTTLDVIIEEYGEPDYIKIDVEGYEYEVIPSLTKLLNNTIISFEWAEEQKDKIQYMLEYLLNLGYQQFSYTHADEVLFSHQIIWKSYQELNFIEHLVPPRKEKWGMIYVKK